MGMEPSQLKYNKEKLEEVLKSYSEIKITDLKTSIINKNRDSPNILQVIEDENINYIKRDVPRCLIFIEDKKLKKKLHLILEKVLLDMEIPYTQSMADVISIIVYYFYETKGIAS